jgi:hypothetical protein
MSHPQPTDEPLPSGGHSVFGSSHDFQYCNSSSTCFKVFSINVFYKSDCIRHCVPVSTTSKIAIFSNVLNLTSFYSDEQLLEILTSLLSRTFDVQIQINAARCLTYLHRSGSLPATDNRVVYKTLPCLARLCSPEFDDDTRATASESLAYLAEVSSE